MTTRPLTPLFPPITPYSTGFLAVGAPHEIYWEQSGNPDGVPIVLLHGGPGAGATPNHRRFFDPAHYRIVIFDQRGAGRSTPLGEVADNTLAYLVEDMEKLRKRLGIERWHIFGGSWGSTLSLAYATKYPARCLSLILRGIFLCEKGEIDWFINDMRHIFPEAWDRFAGFIPESERGDLLAAYHARLFSNDTDLQMQAALRWAHYEAACSALIPGHETIATDEQRQRALALARIEAHYFRHGVIDPANSFLARLDRIRAIPSVIVQGRYDVICPIGTAYRMHQLWPEADFVVVPDAGHSALDPPLRSRLIEATENMKTIT